jgi:hypothetical protein
VSNRLMTLLQSAAFPFRHCTAPLDGIEPPYLRSERSALPLSERGILLVRVAGHDPAASASQARRSAC